MVKVLEKAGCKVDYNGNQTCCGQPAFNAGFWDEARAVCSKFLKDFDTADYIVCPSASCVGFVRNYYTKLFDNSSLHNKVKDISNRVFEFTEFLTDILKIENFNAELNGTATYHDSCAALRECKIKDGPRRLLGNVKGLRLTEMNDVETCCGFGGTFCVAEEAVSVKMGKDRVTDHTKNGAEYITSSDLSCLMHLEGILHRNKSSVKIIHIAEILNATI